MNGRAPAFIALIAIACGANPLPAWKTHDLAPAQRAHEKMIVDVGEYGSNQAWQASPWYRVDDTFVLPIFVALADDNTVCIVPAADWAILQPHDQYPCPGPWRMPRPVR